MTLSEVLAARVRELEQRLKRAQTAAATQRKRAEYWRTRATSKRALDGYWRNRALNRNTTAGSGEPRTGSHAAAGRRS